MINCKHWSYGVTETGGNCHLNLYGGHPSYGVCFKKCEYYKDYSLETVNKFIDLWGEKVVKHMLFEMCKYKNDETFENIKTTITQLGYDKDKHFAEIFKLLPETRKQIRIQKRYYEKQISLSQCVIELKKAFDEKKAKEFLLAIALLGEENKDKIYEASIPFLSEEEIHKIKRDTYEEIKS
jgi:hypothetical protein